MSRVLQMKDFDRNIPDPTIEGRGNFLAAEQFASRDNAPHAVQESDLNQYIRRNPLQISLSAREDGEIIFVTTTASAAVLQDQEGRSYLPKTQDELSYDSSIRASAIDRTGKLVAIAIDDMVGIYEIVNENDQIRFAHRASYLTPGDEAAPKVTHVVFSGEKPEMTLRFSDDSKKLVRLGSSPRGLLLEEHVPGSNEATWRFPAETTWRLSA